MDWEVSNDEKFVERISLIRLPFPWSNSLFLLCSVFDLRMSLDDRLSHHMAMLGPT
jgi:hypothetical protein